MIINVKKLLITFPTLLLFGCATTNNDEAAKYLSGECLEAFQSFKYQYVASVNGRTAFAVAQKGANQVCGSATNFDIQDGYLINLPPIDRLEALAIKRCEANKPKDFDSPCILFARGKDIVYKKTLSDGLK